MKKNGQEGAAFPEKSCYDRSTVVDPHNPPKIIDSIKQSYVDKLKDEKIKEIKKTTNFSNPNLIRHAIGASVTAFHDVERIIEDDFADFTGKLHHAKNDLLAEINGDKKTIDHMMKNLENAERRLTRLEQTDHKLPVASIVIVAICFLLSIVDLFLLRDAVSRLMPFADTMSVSILTLATIILGMFFAFEWGKRQGEKLDNKIITRHSLSFFLLWVLMGIFLSSLRIISSFLDTDSESIRYFGLVIEDIIFVPFLDILYIATGLSIRSSASKILNKNRTDYSKAKKEYERLKQEEISAKATLDKEIGVFKNYANIFSEVKKQEKNEYDMLAQTQEALKNELAIYIIENTPVSPEVIWRIISEAFEASKR